jgi:integrase
MRQKMFTEPKVVITEDLTIRGYVSFYYNGKRFREYNGKRLKLDINPNHTNTLADKKRALATLQFEFKKALQSGWSPLQIDQNIDKCFDMALKEVLEDKLESPYSKTYKRDLQKLYNQLHAFLPQAVLKQYVRNVIGADFDAFLNQFKTSNRHYMNKRRTLSVFFSAIVKKGYLTRNIILNTDTLKVKSVLHEPYNQEELRTIIKYLKKDYPNLRLCCMLTYGCLLRPHQEIRHLKRKHINEDYTQISLSGEENKSGRIRTVPIPAFIGIELKARFADCQDMETNLFTLSTLPFNDDYFKTQWSRAKSEMLKIGIIRKGQTLYSFRHTAAISVYKKTKDIQILKQLLQHSNMIVTLTYLRGLGELNNDELKNILPEL